MPVSRASAASKKLRIVAIGGGTGLSSLLHGFKQHMRCGVNGNGSHADVALDITAVVTVTDDGGSSGRLRRDFDVLPPGDIRSCLVAMSEDEALLSRLFQYRFGGGKGLKGHNLGNLFLTALADLTGDFTKAVRHASDVLATCGQIYPSTLANVALEATLIDGTTVQGETRISKSKTRIESIRLKPSRCQPLPATLEAIAGADLITLGPGSLFTSVIPNVLVKGIAEAIHSSRALKLYFVNLMGQPGETLQFTASDHVRAINKHAGLDIIDVAVVNTKPISPVLKRRYAAAKALPVENDIDQLEAMGIEVVARELASGGERVRHEPGTIARIAIDLAGERQRKRPKLRKR